MKTVIFLGQLDSSASILLGQPQLVVDAFAAGTLLKSVTAGYATSDFADASTASECLIAPRIGIHYGGTIETLHTVGDTVEPHIIKSGEFANVRVTAGSALILGTALASNGDGTLKVAATDGTDVVLFNSDEVVTVGGTATLVQVRKA